MTTMNDALTNVYVKGDKTIPEHVRLEFITPDGSMNFEYTRKEAFRLVARIIKAIFTRK